MCRVPHEVQRGRCYGQSVLLESFCRKQSAFWRIWRVRWLVLTPEALLSFRSKRGYLQGAAPTERFALSTLGTVRGVDQVAASSELLQAAWLVLATAERQVCKCVSPGQTATSSSYVPTRLLAAAAGLCAAWQYPQWRGAALAAQRVGNRDRQCTPSPADWQPCLRRARAARLRAEHREIRGALLYWTGDRNGCLLNRACRHLPGATHCPCSCLCSDAGT